MRGVVDETYAVDPYEDPHPADGKVFSVALVAGGRTFYALYGNFFVFACLALLTAIALLTRRNQPRGSGRSSDAGLRQPPPAAINASACLGPQV